MQSERTLKEASHFFRDSHFSDCENHLCSRVQYCSWKVIVPFPWTINFLPAQLSFRSQWITSCLAFRHPSITGDHVSALWRLFLSFCWNLYRSIWDCQSLPHSLQLKEVLWGVSYTSTIFRQPRFSVICLLIPAWLCVATDLLRQHTLCWPVTDRTGADLWEGVGEVREFRLEPLI